MPVPVEVVADLRPKATDKGTPKKHFIPFDADDWTKLTTGFHGLDKPVAYKALLLGIADGTYIVSKKR